ncbi:MAG: GNAT family N-acetyltransferase [Thaumarchaeota archaeon]|nr:MAG: GNAT family N-acetyltransferase [Nitrososphaerota archaeon]
MKIRLAREEDLPQLISILSQLNPRAERCNLERAKEVLRELSKSGQQFLMVCEVSGKIVGTAELVIKHNLTHGGRPYGYIENVVVDEDYRGKGVGNKLIESCIKIAREKGCYKLILTCKDDLVKWYGKFGFREFGEKALRLDL